MSLLLTLNIFYTPFSNVSIVNFEQVNLGWGDARNIKLEADDPFEDLL